MFSTGQMGSAKENVPLISTINCIAKCPILADRDKKKNKLQIPPTYLLNKRLSSVSVLVQCMAGIGSCAWGKSIYSQAADFSPSVVHAQLRQPLGGHLALVYREAK